MRGEYDLVVKGWARALRKPTYSDLNHLYICKFGNCPRSKDINQAWSKTAIRDYCYSCLSCLFIKGKFLFYYAVVPSKIAEMSTASYSSLRK